MFIIYMQRKLWLDWWAEALVCNDETKFEQSSSIAINYETSHYRYIDTIIFVWDCEW